MRILTTLPQDDLNDVPAAARAAETAGYDGLVTMENAMSKAGQWDRMAAEISDDVVRLFAAVGTHPELARAVEARFGGVVDTVALSGGYGTRQDIPPDLVQDIRRIPSVFTGYRTGW